MSGIASTTDPGGYDGVARLFHWVVVGLLVVQYLTKWLPSRVASEGVLNAWHLAVGPTILALMLLRLVWRLTHRPPSPPASLSVPVRWLSRATHWAFYGLLIVLPLFGWASASGFGARPYLLGFIPLPGLIGTNEALAERLGGVHGVLAGLLLVVVVLHVSGALFHLLVKRDGVFQRMLSFGGSGAGV